MQERSAGIPKSMVTPELINVVVLNLNRIAKDLKPTMTATLEYGRQITKVAADIAIGRTLCCGEKKGPWVDEYDRH